MMPRRSLTLAVLLAVLGGPAAAQGVKVAGDPTAGGPKADAPKTEEAKPKKKASSAKAKKKKKPAPESKYKSRALAESVENAYLFDENGNPVEGPKKKAAKAKKAPESSEPSEGKPACSADEPCTDKDGKNPDADAL
jgi:hypothetical protein